MRGLLVAALWHLSAFALWCLTASALCGLTACNAVEFRKSMELGQFERAGVVPRTLALPSGSMKVYVGGAVSPLLFLHGFGFGALESWRQQVPALSREHRIVAPDLYWFADSVPSRPIETPRDEAQGLIEMLDALGIVKIDVVADSFGALVALDLAREHPDRVGRLVLVDALSLRFDRAEKEAIFARLRSGKRMAAIVIPESVDELRAFLADIFYRPTWVPRWALAQVLTELQRNRVPKTRLCQGVDAELVDEDALRSIVTPTLVIWGRHDPLLPLSLGRRLARAIPGAELSIFEESGHSPMLEEPARFNAVVRAFLAR